MATGPMNDREWLLDTMSDYYDELKHALAARGGEFEALSTGDRKHASELVSQRVHEFSKLFDNDLIVKVALSMIEDLYKAGVSATVWGPGYESYVSAVWGTMFAALRDRGYTIRYIVENTWPDDELRPVQFFPSLFGLAGVTYICPSAMAAELPELKGAPVTTAGLRPGLAEGRFIAQEALKELVKQGKHFAYFETDFDPGCLDIVFALPKPPGTIEIFRNEALVPGSTVALSLTALDGSLPAT